jgi:hypothetical protein
LSGLASRSGVTSAVRAGHAHPNTSADTPMSMIVRIASLRFLMAFLLASF